MKTLYESLMERVIETAVQMNRMADAKDLVRNCTNCGALSELVFMLCKLGFSVDECTYQDGEYFRCAGIKADGKYIIRW